MDKFTIVFEKCEEGGYHAYMRENPGVQTEGETIQETMENFIDAFELFFRDELEGEIAKQSLDADRFEARRKVATDTLAWLGRKPQM
jgi:predicted RNase H-like HicB family nuclease